MADTYALATRRCQSWHCERQNDAVMLLAVTCENGCDLDRALCQKCFDWIWGLPGAPGCSRCPDEPDARILEAIRLRPASANDDSGAQP